MQTNVQIKTVICEAEVGDEVRYDELNNEEEALSDDSDLTSSDGGDQDNVVDDSRPTAAALLDVEGSPLVAEDDFASAVARAAQLAGLTVVGSTVTGSNRGQYTFHGVPIICIQGAYNSEKPGKPGNIREFANSGKLREFEIYSGNLSDACSFFVTQSETHKMT